MKKTAIITGASRGIGRETAALFAKNGYNVIINYNNSEAEAKRLEKELSEYGGVLAFKADICDTEQVKTLFRTAFERFGSVDVLVNNAGIAAQQLLTDVTDTDYERMMSVNFGGVFKCCREAVPYMLKNHSGAVVNISSMWGICGASCESVYSASKAAVIGFTKALAKELGPSGIRVNCIAPGVIDTDMNKNLTEETLSELTEVTPLLRIGKPSDVAELALFLATDKASFITGQIISADGGFAV